jgi:hypothetical protein
VTGRAADVSPGLCEGRTPSVGRAEHRATLDERTW